MIYCLKHTEIKGTACKKYNDKITWGSGDYQITSLLIFYHDFKSGIVKFFSPSYYLKQKFAPSAMTH